MEANATEKRTFSIGVFLGRWAALLAIGLLMLFFTVRLPNMFLTINNMVTILRSISIITIIAMGLTFTLSIGGFDLAGGYLATISSYVTMSLIIWYAWHPALTASIAIVVCLGLTMCSMFLIVVCKIPDLLATCAMMFILEGLGLTYTGGGSISAGMPRPNGEMSVGSVPQRFKVIGTALTIVIIMIVSVIVVHIFLTYTKYGRYIYATGGNKAAAKLSGINVRKYRVVAGLLSALFLSIGGILVCSRAQSAQINGAVAFQMPALAAVFIGRSVAGQGKPNALGTLVGSVLVGVLENGLVMMSVPFYSVNGVKGLVLAIALISAYYDAKED